LYWKLSLKKQNIILESYNSIIHPLNRLKNKEDLQSVLKFITSKIINELKIACTHDYPNDEVKNQLF
jgi:hypothetical protein